MMAASSWLYSATTAFHAASASAACAASLSSMPVREAAQRSRL
jgi:hypothetical protein